MSTGDLKFYLHQIKESIAILEKRIYQHLPKHIALTYIDHLTKNDEIDTPDTISVNNIEGHSELSAQLIKIINNFYAPSNDDASTKITVKNPGIVIMPHESFEDIKSCLDTINTSKNNFYSAFLKCADNRETRFQIIHNIFPRLVTLQVFRSIPYLTPQDSGIKKISFYWKNSLITKKVYKSEVLDILYKKKANQETKPLLFPSKQRSIWADIDFYIDIVKQLQPNAQMRFKRTSGIPNPAANVIINNQPKMINLRTSLPVFLFNEPQYIELLTNLNKRNESISNRAEKSSYTPLIKEIGLELKT